MEINKNQYQFKTRSKGILNWYPSTGGILFQGKPHSAEKLWENAQEVGGHFKARLEALVEQYPLVGAVHGSGFYLGLELVRDRQTLEPATEETALLCDRLRELGIFMQPTGDYLNILKIKPPMVTSRHSVDFFVDMLAKVLEEGL